MNGKIIKWVNVLVGEGLTLKLLIIRFLRYSSITVQLQFNYSSITVQLQFNYSSITVILIFLNLFGFICIHIYLSFYFSRLI